MKGLITSALTWCSLLASGGGVAAGRSFHTGRPADFIVRDEGAALQDIVTWDADSIFIRGQRVLIYSGEVHPYRLPVPSLHLDIFQKIKALGYNCVSFYVDWALLEGTPGVYRAEGIFDLKPFFDAATEAGIWLIARPGPYINAEVSGGGFPGWIQRVNGTLRTRDEHFLRATDLYMSQIGKTLAAHQITNGGPIIFVQPENEYTQALPSITPFPDPQYMTYIYNQLRSAGIVVPFISNDASAKGNNAPGKPAPVDIYGHDGYPLGFDCANPTVWPDGKLPTNWRALHQQQSPSTPYAIVEFQAGSFDPWGGPGFEKCATLVSAEFERVFYKQLYSFGVTILNLYMTWGGTNWGNLGHPGGYTSYDYAAVIREDRRIDREKYSEQKLQANFLKVSPSYLTADRGNVSTTAYSTSKDIGITPAFGKDGSRFYFVRHATYNSLASTSYQLTIPTTAFGNITIPQYKDANGTSGTLSLHGRDSKVHVADYNIGGATLVYSTAEIFTWHKYDDKTVLVVYGGPGETHELVLAVTGLEVLEGKDSVKSIATRGYTLLNFNTEGARKVARVGVGAPYIYVYMLDRNEAYNYWTIDQTPHSTSNTSAPIIVKAGYLVRTASFKSSSLTLTGDLNKTTTPLEVIGFPSSANNLTSLTFNARSFPLSLSPSTSYSLTTTLSHTPPQISVPRLAELKWHSISSLPEVDDLTYDDSKWPSANLTSTFNTLLPLKTPVSLYGSDYGFHTGSLVFRGSFIASGSESSFSISTSGGSAFGHSIWLNSMFLGSWAGYDAATVGNGTYAFKDTLKKGEKYVITVVIDVMGLDENWTIGTETMKNPRGILDYALSGHANKNDITWKITGNLGGEAYKDVSRGPLNEGGLWIERNGLHLPGALSSTTSFPWKPSPPPLSSPPSTNSSSYYTNTTTTTAASPGITFFATTFTLSLPSPTYDIPLSFTFSNATANHAPAYRAQLFVNGFHFGKYVSNVGPQTKFPVPEGILNYQGENYLGVTVWVLEQGNAVRGLGDLELVVDGVESDGGEGLVWSGRKAVEVVEGEKFKARDGAY